MLLAFVSLEVMYQKYFRQEYIYYIACMLIISCICGWAIRNSETYKSVNLLADITTMQLLLELLSSITSTTQLRSTQCYASTIIEYNCKNLALGTRNKF